MSAELMMVLSMRKKEVAFQPARPTVTVGPPMTPRTTATTARFAPTMTPQQVPMYHHHPPHQAPTTAKTALATMGNGACVSPHAVTQVAWTAAYDQFGFTWQWIVDACAHFALQRQTAHFAMQYAQLLIRQRALREETDPFHAPAPPADLPALQRELRSLGITCVFMAAKIEEVHPPKANDFAEFATEHGDLDLSTEDIVRQEGELLKELKWNLHPTTPYSWLLFLLVGEALDQPLFSTSDFASTKIDLSGRHDLFTNAIRLIDVAMLDGQSVEYLPSVLAGAALLLVDPLLEFFFTAQFLQLDPKVLWDCKNWLHCVAQAVHEFDCQGSRNEDRWGKIAKNDVVFVQTHVAVPSHLAYGLLASENPAGGYHMGENAYGVDACNPAYGGYGGEYPSSICASPSSSDNYGCFCKGNYHTCGHATVAADSNVYHYKFGWQNAGDNLSYDLTAMNQDTMRYA
ncbi:TPA: hypothetical protein N0F65_007666 [Lagenidium giganteum]|uniref:Cyclin-like domain-containing protein n=1 Tax=Lagenidium giganteum TaxID=4803 RepID=A0AAV2Z7F6_9STRA|nr:TPA: hypothetical protein N0F65_007666 [Lagenidium giganteum]